MPGENDLQMLLKTLKPEMLNDEYVFCSLNKNQKIDDYDFISSFKEQEGFSIIITKEEADIKKIQYNSVFKCISLSVHSSLTAVGLTAAVSKKLAENNISSNVVAAYYHDHIFVPKDKSLLAIDLLESLSS